MECELLDPDKPVWAVVSIGKKQSKKLDMKYYSTSASWKYKNKSQNPKYPKMFVIDTEGLNKEM